MSKLQLDVRKLLSLPVNNGTDAFVGSDGCGCAKGNFYRATTSEALSYGEADIDTRRIYCQYVPISESTNQNKLLQMVLNRAEEIHIGLHKNETPAERRESLQRKKVLPSRPQFAKLWLLRALRMFNLVDFVNTLEETTDPVKVIQLQRN